MCSEQESIQEFANKVFKDSMLKQANRQYIEDSQIFNMSLADHSQSV